jgi:hypothetical protein
MYFVSVKSENYAKFCENSLIHEHFCGNLKYPRKYWFSKHFTKMLPKMIVFTNIFA